MRLRPVLIAATLALAVMFVYQVAGILAYEVTEVASVISEVRP